MAGCRMTSSSVETLVSVDTEYTADSIEWCPCPEYSDLVLCGTYQLVNTHEMGTDGKQDGVSGHPSSESMRKGILNAYLFNRAVLADEKSPLNLISQTELPAVLDLKWSHCYQDLMPVFAIVDSDGGLSLWQLATIGDECPDQSLADNLKINKIRSISLGTDKMALSLDWSNRVHKNLPAIIASDSCGMITMTTVDSNDLTIRNQWKAHDFEAWIAAFNYWNTNIVYTGGDDCSFKGWDMRMSTDCALFRSRKHSAGVCSIQSNPKNENILATGSYDESVLIWDTRQMRHPVSETAIGGGVWRVKWDPWNAKYLLTAAMYNGFHILDCAEINESGQNIVCSYMEHNSIAYGADWCHKSHAGGKMTAESGKSTSDKADVEEDTSAALITTCSFYDHLMNVWVWHHCLSAAHS